MQTKSTRYVFPLELAERVLSFSRAPERREACAALQAITGYDPLDWGASLEPVPATGYTGQAGLTAPKNSLFYAENPGTLRQPEEGLPTYQVSVSDELKKARQALYDATRLLMRSAPDDALTDELFVAAFQAWSAHLAAEPQMWDYTTGYEALKNTYEIWSGKLTQGRINLGKRAKLPPFFDGNTQLVDLFIQSPPDQCDLQALRYLPNLKALTLLVDAESPVINTARMLLPHLTNRSDKKTAIDDVLVYLSADGHPPFVNVVKRPV